MSKRAIAGLAAAFWASAGCGGTSVAGPTNSAPPENLTIAIVQVDPSTMPIWLGQLDGTYAKYGVNVTINTVGGNVVSVLAAGQADINDGGSGLAFNPVLNGLETSIIYNAASGGVGAFVFGVPKVHSITDCTRMVANAQGTANYAWAISLKSIYEANYTVVPISDVNTQRAAISGGTVDCAIGNTFFSLASSGEVHLIVDPRDKSSLPANWPNGVVEGVLWGLKSTLQSKRSAIVRFLKAYQEELKKIVRKDSATELTTELKKLASFQSFTEVALTQSLEVDIPFFSPNDGYISATTWPATPAFYQNGGFPLKGGASDPRWSYSRRIDMTYYVSALGKPAGA